MSYGLSEAVKRAVDRYAADRKDRSGERWITINGGSAEDGEGGGTPVKIDDDGTIVAGPKGLADKGVKKLSDFGKKKGEASPSDSSKSPEDHYNQLPDAVKSHIKFHTDRLHQAHKAIEHANKVGARYGWEVATQPKMAADVEESRKRLDEFRKLASEKGIDGDAAISHIGGEPSRDVFDKAKSWGDESPAKASDKSAAPESNSEAWNALQASIEKQRQEKEEAERPAKEKAAREAKAKADAEQAAKDSEKARSEQVRQGVRKELLDKVEQMKPTDPSQIPDKITKQFRKELKNSIALASGNRNDVMLEEATDHWLATHGKKSEPTRPSPTTEPASPKYIARGNTIFDANGVRHGAFRNEEKAKDAAERWNVEGKPGEQKPTPTTPENKPPEKHETFAGGVATTPEGNREQVRQQVIKDFNETGTYKGGRLHEGYLVSKDAKKAAVAAGYSAEKFADEYMQHNGDQIDKSWAENIAYLPERKIDVPPEVMERAKAITGKVQPQDRPENPSTASQPEQAKPSQAAATEPQDEPSTPTEKHGIKLSPATAPGVKHDDIPYEAAYNAHRGTSFVPEKRAIQRQNDYVNQMNADWDYISSNIAPGQEEAAKAEFERYRDGYRNKFMNVLGAASRTMSPMITGPSRFPTASNQKKIDSEMNRYGELKDFRNRALAAIKKKVAPAGEGGPIKSSDSNAVEALQAKLAGMEKLQEDYKKINAAHRAFKKNPASLDASDLSDKAKDLIRNYKPAYSWEPNPVAPYQLTNLNANIKRVRDRIQQVSAMKAGPAKQTEYSGGVSVSEDPEAARIRIHFPGKPAPDVISSLKSNGFRWSPSEGAWQRHLNNGGRNAVDSLLKRLGHEPTGTQNAEGDADPDLPEMIVPEEQEDRHDKIHYSRHVAEQVRQQVDRYAASWKDQPRDEDGRFADSDSESDRMQLAVENTMDRVDILGNGDSIMESLRDHGTLGTRHIALQLQPHLDAVEQALIDDSDITSVAAHAKRALDLLQRGHDELVAHNEARDRRGHDPTPADLGAIKRTIDGLREITELKRFTSDRKFGKALTDAGFTRGIKPDGKGKTQVGWEKDGEFHTVQQAIRKMQTGRKNVMYSRLSQHVTQTVDRYCRR